MTALDLVIVNYNSGNALAQCLDSCLNHNSPTIRGAKRPADPVGWRRVGNEQKTVLPEAKKSSVNAVARQSEGRAFDSTPSCAAGFHTQYERREARLLLNVTVIDNASGDNSWQVAEHNPQVKLIKNQHNKGYATACNQAAERGNNELIAFINPDCFIQADDLNKLAQHLQQQTNGGIISCRINNPDGSLQRANRRRLPTFWRVFAGYLRLEKLPLIKGINITDHKPPPKPIEVEACSGAFFIIKRTLFERIGGFDTGYPLHFEDLDLFKKVNDAGFHITYHPTITATHLKGHSKQSAKQIKKWKKQGLCRYFKKHRPPIETLLIKIITKIL